MQGRERLPLRQWIWRAFVQSALIPLILVECGLIAAYLFSNESMRSEQISHLQAAALHDLAGAVEREGRIISGHLQAVEVQLEAFRRSVDLALGNHAFVPDALELKRHALTPSGVYYSRTDDGRAASFYANSTPVMQQDRAKALRLSQVDPLMRSLYESIPMISALYFNTWDSYNRIYPWFDTPSQYPHDMRIPEFNFYYQANAENNPERARVWTDVYLDPAGQGWMLSAIAPVYRGDFLEGVAGIDITVDKMLDEISSLNVPWQGYAMLVSADNRIMALPPMGEQDFALRELTQYSYEEAVRREVLKPQDFNLARQTSMSPVLEQMALRTNGVLEVQLGGRHQLVAWSEIPQTGWRLLMVVDEEQIFFETNDLAQRYWQLGYVLIAGLVFFYLLFFAWMWLRSRQLSNELSEPMGEIVKLAYRLGGRDFNQPAPRFQVAEVDDLAQAVYGAGQQLQMSERERQAVQDMLALVLESTTETLWRADVRKGMVETDLRFAQRFALPGTHLSFEQLERSVHPDDLPRVQATLRLLESEEFDYFDAEYRIKDGYGSYIWVLSRGRTMRRDEQGRPLLVVGTLVDITRLKQVQEALHEASLEALAASKAKSLFLSSISHEVRTPLNAIHGFAQLIEVETQDKANAQQETDYAREIISASRHLTALVDDILELSSLETRQQRLHMQSVDVETLLNSCVELIRLEAQAKQLTVQIQNMDMPLQVLADPRRARQILLNLLSNAIKYNQPHGEVLVGALVHQGRVRIWVCDNGPGLSPEQCSQLFQPFQRLGRESSNIPGTGIGLVLSQDLARLMGGSIGVQSVLGQGSSFWLELAQAQELGAPQSSEIESARLKLLCVELSPWCQDLLQDQSQALQLYGAASFEQAQQWLDGNIPALLILDVSLADGGAFKLLEAIRGQATLQSVPVLVVGRSFEAGLFEKAITQGASACMTLPVTAEELRQCVMSLLYNRY